MRRETIYIGGKNTGTILCKECGRSKTVDVSGLENIRIPRRVKCGCGATFEVVFEKRRYVRKGVHILGRCWRKNATEFQAISVRALSRIGVGFQVLSDNLQEVQEVKNIDADDLLYVEFQLDKDPRTMIRSKVKVQNISRGFIGGEFHIPDEHILKALGFYLMP